MLDELLQESVDDQELERDQYVVLTMENQEFGIQALRVREISTVLGTSKVPNAPPYIEGILNLRGRLASVINLRVKFGMGAKEHDEDTRIIIVDMEGHPIGILVDAVEEVLRIPDNKIETLSETALAVTADEYIVGVGMLEKRLIILLDLDRVLSRTELAEAGALPGLVERARTAVDGRDAEERRDLPGVVEAGRHQEKTEE
jgi:purine-binding chemotaxis protein CheW